MYSFRCFDYIVVLVTRRTLLIIEKLVRTNLSKISENLTNLSKISENLTNLSKISENLKLVRTNFNSLKIAKLVRC